MRVEPQVGRLAHRARSRSPLLRGDHRLGRLLADLLQDRVVALGEQLRDVGLRRDRRPCGCVDRRRRGAPGCRQCSVSFLVDGRRDPSAPARPSRHARRSRVCWKKQLCAAGVAGDAADLLDLQQDRVVVAVEADLVHLLHVAGLLALAPQLACASATSRPPRRSPRSARAPRGSSRRHQHVARCRVLRHRGTRPSPFQRHFVEPRSTLSRTSMPRRCHVRLRLAAPCTRRSGRCSRPAPRRRLPFCDALGRCSRLPTPPEAITGHAHRVATPRASARGRSRRGAVAVHAGQQDLARAAPRPSAAPIRRRRGRSRVRPPWV